MSVSINGTNGIVFNDGSIQKVSAFTGFRNRIINGDMRIDQRNAGAAITPTTTPIYSVDRWRTNISQASKMTFQQQVIASPQSCDGNRYTLSCSTASAYTPTSSDFFGVNQFVEGFNTADLLWGTSSAKTITLSFWVYCGLTGNFGGAIRTGDGSNYSYPFIYTINTANTWEKKTITITGPTSGTWGTTNVVGLDVWFSLGAGSTFIGTANTWAAANYVHATGAVNLVSTASGSGGNWYITGVQLEAGSTATDFERRPYGTELALCQRYYYLLVNGSSQPIFSGFNASTTRAYGSVYFPVTMRANPVLVSTSGTNYYEIYQGTGTIRSTAITQDLASPRGTSLYSDTTGLTTGYGNFFYSISASSFVAFNAEL